MRGTIIKVPDSNPGIITAEGKQYNFELAGNWQGDAAPSLNQVVEFTAGADGTATTISPVSREVLAQENLNQASKAAKEKAASGYKVIKPYVDLQLGAMTLPVCVVTIIMEICYFFVEGISTSSQGFIGWSANSWTLNEFLGLQLSLQNSFSQFTFLELLGVVIMFLPWVSPWLPIPKRNFLNALPFILVASMYALRLSKAHGLIDDVMNSSPGVFINTYEDLSHFQTHADFLNNIVAKATSALMANFTFSIGYWCVLALSFILLILSFRKKKV